jgi:hypothetical protein
MDLVQAFTGIRQAQIASEVNTTVTKKAMALQRQQGANALALLKSAQIGQVKAGDQLVAAATGLGGCLDTYA